MRRRDSVCVWVLVGLALWWLATTAKSQTSTTLLLPSAIAYDAVGNVYFADTNRNQVLESTLGGQLVVVAGSSVQGFAGDGGQATSAELNAPQGVSVGADGTVYIADTGNQRVRTVVAGTISTFAGNGIRGFAGDGGTATAAEFSMPTAIALDANGALLVCDSNNQRLRRISGGVIATIAGSGLQGFAGDGGAAIAAELDTPIGVAAGADGKIYISDSRNNRVRVVSGAGVISSFAGNGVAGFSGDGGSATAAELAMPRGLVLLPSGALLIADENNQRVRMVDTAGVISTVAGTGQQGGSAGTGDDVSLLAALLNSPRAVGVSSFAQPAVVDTANKLVRVEATNAALYSPAGLVSGRVSSVKVNLPATATYGQLSAGVTVSGAAGTPQGAVRWLDGGTLVGNSALSLGSATSSLTGVGVGVHALSAEYVGDGLNPSATSANASVTVTPAAVIATANAATMQYGMSVPALTGTLTGVLAQDTSNVAAVFSSVATNTSPVGMYPIGATLTGSASANYALSLSADSGSLTIHQAASTVTEQVNAQGYAGMPMILSAVVTPPGRGTPTGTVTFLDGTNVVAIAPVTGGSATGTYLAPATGVHALTASYGGDANFLPETSAVVSTTVSTLPDFTVSVPAPAQSVQGGLIANYTVVVAGQGAFSGAVSLAASGVPSGATVTFTPPSLIPGTGSATSTMSVQTTTAMASNGSVTGVWWALGAMIPIAMLGAMRQRKLWLPLLGIGLCMLGLSGCGTRSLSTVVGSSHSYTFSVTGTGTNLAGATIAHSAVVTLTVE